MLEHTIGRIYQQGFVKSDFVEDGMLQPGLVALEPVRPPSVTMGGIHTSVDWANMPAPRCIMHRVVAVGPKDETYSGPALSVEPGDVVVIRPAMAEPIHPNMEPLLVHSRHILAKMK